VNKEKIFILIYLFILVIELISATFLIPEFFHFVAKPSLLISLIIYYLSCEQQNEPIKKFMLYALIFSLIGDILLMLVSINAMLFIFGLVAFLIAHSMYILAFSKERNKNLNPFFFMGMLLVCGALIFTFLSSYLGNLLVPVCIYIMLILIMVLFAYFRKNNVVKKSYVLVLTGALFFVISDILLAINKFRTPIPFSNIWIMTAYAIAQLLIVIGIIKARPT
jgi:uncharacterized membrane protein YhhN